LRAGFDIGGLCWVGGVRCGYVFFGRAEAGATYGGGVYGFAGECQFGNE
jgi:hypothetical protein